LWRVLALASSGDMEGLGGCWCNSSTLTKLSATGGDSENGGRVLRSMFEWVAAGGGAQAASWLVAKKGCEWGSGENAGSSYNVGEIFLIRWLVGLGLDDEETLEILNFMEFGPLAADGKKNWDKTLVEDTWGVWLPDRFE
jgi:hypothetical protein